MNTFLPGMKVYRSLSSNVTHAAAVNPGMDWEYLDMSKQFRSEFVPYGDETYELVVVVGTSQPRHVVLVT